MAIGLKTFIFYNLGLGKRIPTIEPADLVPPQNLKVSLEVGFGTCGGLSPQEGLWLVLLAAHMRCTSVFEIGTATGLTTYNLALNLTGVVYTLDLSPTTTETLLPIGKADRAFMGVKDHQRYWLGKSYSARIVLLYGDSARFNFTPYHKRMDLVFVDGSHSYDYVRKDSETALTLINDRGFIVWHDYAPCWPGVVRALNELVSRIPLVHIKGTSLIVYRPQPEQLATE